MTRGTQEIFQNKWKLVLRTRSVKSNSTGRWEQKELSGSVANELSAFFLSTLHAAKRTLRCALQFGFALVAGGVITRQAAWGVRSGPTQSDSFSGFLLIFT